MLRAIVSGSLRVRVIVLALALLTLFAGPALLRNVPLDVFPEFAPPLVEIQTEAPGLSTEEVENLVTVPIENAVNGVSWLKTLRSKSVLGLSSVVIIFEPGTDLLTARQLVSERVARVQSQLPDVASLPVLLSPLSSTSRVLKIGVWSDSLSQVELTTLMKWTVRPRLMAVPGVANVAIWGQRDRQIQVRVDPDRLRAHGVSLDQVVNATRDAATLSAGGFIDTPNQRLAVTQRSAVHGPEDIAGVVVSWNAGAPLRIGDVARVTEGYPAPIGDAVINDQPGLLLIVEKQPWGNTLQVTHEVERVLDSFRPALAGVQLDPTIFRPATFIEMSLANLRTALLLACLLVAIVLAVFLWDWRSTLISLLAIPLSLLAAVLVLRFRGVTIDTMVLAGLVIALGEVVDDAIIDIENIVRRLRLNRAAGNPRRAFDVVLDASLEVRGAVVYGSVIVVLVLVPVFLMGGLAGSFFRPLATAYVLAILASLAVALTVTPALGLLMLRGHPETRESPLVTGLKQRYRAFLPWLLERPRLLLRGTIGLLLVGALAFPLLGEEFLPHFREYDFLMHWVEKPGTSLDAMRRITVQASRELRAIPGVRNFGSHIGRAEVADEVVGPNFTELWISLDPSVDYDATVSRVQTVVDGYPGLYRDLLTYLRERIKEVLTGASATMVIRIYGPDLEGLRAKAEEVAQALGPIPGIADLKVQPQVLVPQVQVRFRPEAAERFGLRPADVQRAVATLVKGQKVGEFYEGQMVFDVAVWSEEHVRSDPTALQRLNLDLPGGGQVPLRDVADVQVVATPNEITRENSSRKIDVTANARGRSLGAVARDVEQALGGIEFDRGYHPELLGEYTERQRSRNRMLGLAVIVVFGILLILHADFESWRLAGLVWLSLPCALLGGVAAAFLSGGLLSLGSLVGFVTVLGVAARNGIMLISHYRHLMDHEGMKFGPELVVRGAEERLSPILMTALATGLALVPIVARGMRPGQEIEHPMAVVILGGLVTSTLLNLYVIPTLFLKYGRRAEATTRRASPDSLP